MDLGWDDILMENTSPEKAANCLAMYAVFLGTGSTIMARQVKVATIKEYLLAVSSFLACFSGRDARKLSPTDQDFAPAIKNCLEDLQKYEKRPDRRDPYSAEMHLESRSRAAKVLADPDSEVRSLHDWLEMGLMAGFRRNEWAQPAYQGNPSTPEECSYKEPVCLRDLPMVAPRLPAIRNNKTRAFCVGDVRAQLHTGELLVGRAIVKHPLSSIRKMWLMWRQQKNGEHGEEKMFTCNPNPDGTCFIRHMYSVLQRHERLRQLDPCVNDHTPLAAFYNKATGRVRLITSDRIETYLRSLASVVYKLDPNKDKEKLQKWSSHSIRVGACVILHSQGHSPLDIKWLLRWKSDAFMLYLRNAAVLSDKQNQSVDKAMGMPFAF